LYFRFTMIVCCLFAIWFHFLHEQDVWCPCVALTLYVRVLMKPNEYVWMLEAWLVDFSCNYMNGSRFWGMGIFASGENEVLHMNLWCTTDDSCGLLGSLQCATESRFVVRWCEFGFSLHFHFQMFIIMLWNGQIATVLWNFGVFKEVCDMHELVVVELYFFSLYQ